MATVKTLRSQAKARGVKGWYRMNKEQLLSVLGGSEKPAQKSRNPIKTKASPRSSGGLRSALKTALKKKLSAAMSTPRGRAAIKKKVAVALKSYKAKNANASPDKLRRVASEVIAQEVRARRKQLINSGELSKFNQAAKRARVKDQKRRGYG